MRIVHVIEGLKKAAGTSVFCAEACNQLAAMGHEVTIVCYSPKASWNCALDSRVKTLDLHSFHISSLLQPPNQTIKQSNNQTIKQFPFPQSVNPSIRQSVNPLLIHFHGIWPVVFHRLAVECRQLGVPYVWSTHGMTAPWSLHHKWWKKLPAWWLYQRRDLRGAVAIHCTVEKEVEWNERALGFKDAGIPPRPRCFVAPLGTHLPDPVSPSQFVRCDAPAGDSPIRPLIVLFVGRIYPVKALDNVIRAAAILKNRSLRFRFVGPDQAGHQAELIALCKALGLSYEDESVRSSTPASNFGCDVVFAGPKYDADLAAEYEACDCLILVSHTENFGATVVDAMAHGKPVITSTKTPWSEVAESVEVEGGIGSVAESRRTERRCGWWVANDPESLAKTFAEFAAKPRQELAEMGERGRRLVEEKYTWPAVARKLVAEYKIVHKLKRELDA